MSLVLRILVKPLVDELPCFGAFTYSIRKKVGPQCSDMSNLLELVSMIKIILNSICNLSLCLITGSCRSQVFYTIVNIARIVTSFVVHLGGGHSLVEIWTT